MFSNAAKHNAFGARLKVAHWDFIGATSISKCAALKGQPGLDMVAPALGCGDPVTSGMARRSRWNISFLLIKPKHSKLPRIRVHVGWRVGLPLKLMEKGFSCSSISSAPP